MKIRNLLKNKMTSIAMAIVILLMLPLMAMLSVLALPQHVLKVAGRQLMRAERWLRQSQGK